MEKFSIYYQEGRIRLVYEEFFGNFEMESINYDSDGYSTYFQDGYPIVRSDKPDKKIIRKVYQKFKKKFKQTEV